MKAGPAMNLSRTLPQAGRAAAQRGITTLAVTLLLLAIVTVVVIFATNTAFYELRTTTNENRARIAEQAAEFGVNLGGEYIKSQLTDIVSSDATGWLNETTPKWTACNTLTPIPAGHPCRAERDATRQAQLYFATLADDTDSDPNNDVADLVAAGSVTGVGGMINTDNSRVSFDVETRISALLCRIDTSNPADPQCRREPVKGNNIAVTLIATGNIDSENATATVKETWATYGSFTPASAVPLVASGSVQGLGNAQIVASPNAGGTGLAASVWAPGDVDFEASSGGGVGSVSTCHLGGFLGHGAVPVDDLLTTCAGTGNTGCGCPGQGDPDFLSGHSQSLKQESIDILDNDNEIGQADLPDIEFFPGDGMDSATDPSDDNLFEWVFNVKYVAERDLCNEDNAGGCSEDPDTGATDRDCGVDGNEDCGIYAMREQLGFQFVTCAQLNTLGPNADGLYYVEDSVDADQDSASDAVCTLRDQIGSPDNDVIVVVDEDLRSNSLTLYGMLFVRSSDDTANFSGNGNAQVFGSVVVQGNVNLAGGFDIIYYDWAAAATKPDNPPPARYFGRVGGSWLDDADGI
jgi:hypothetical protein